MANFNKVAKLDSGERRLPACSRRQLADDTESVAKTFARGMSEELFGRLPKRTGWQPVLPGSEITALRLRSAIDD